MLDTIKNTFQNMFLHYVDNISSFCFCLFIYINKFISVSLKKDLAFLLLILVVCLLRFEVTCKFLKHESKYIVKNTHFVKTLFLPIGERNIWRSSGSYKNRASCDPYLIIGYEQELVTC